MIDPHLIDVALALVALEGLALVGWRLWRGAGPRPLPLIANLASGAALLALARALIVQAGAGFALAALSAALVAHGLDLAARWERPRRISGST